MKHPLVRLVREALDRRTARAWLRANDPAAVAAHALWRLNRHAAYCKVAGEDGAAYEVYRVKDMLLQAFWLSGYGRQVTKQTQILSCWRCGGTGEVGPEWHSETCWKCWGSGEYKRILILRFTFEVAGRVYVWHTPESRCWLAPDRLWPAGSGMTEGDGSIELYRGARVLPEHRLTEEHVRVLLAACRVWLARHGGALLPLTAGELGWLSPGLALRRTWWNARDDVRFVVGFPRRWWRSRQRRREMTEIPF